ncbi:hypothetical protein JM654_03765 [Microbacterium oxydans]|nr:hypothetical protein [Microbacterium oxydans]
MGKYVFWLGIFAVGAINAYLGSVAQTPAGTVLGIAAALLALWAALALIATVRSATSGRSHRGSARAARE